MFQSLPSLFSARPKKILDYDIRYVVQSFLQQTLRTDGVVCQGVRAGVIHVRVATPALYEAVRLLEHDLRQELKTQAAYTLEGVKILIG